MIDIDFTNFKQLEFAKCKLLNTSKWDCGWIYASECDCDCECISFVCNQDSVVNNPCAKYIKLIYFLHIKPIAKPPIHFNKIIIKECLLLINFCAYVYAYTTLCSIKFAIVSRVVIALVLCCYTQIPTNFNATCQFKATHNNTLEYVLCT